MPKRDVPYPVLGCLMTAVACHSSPENDVSTLGPEWLEARSPISAVDGLAASALWTYPSPARGSLPGADTSAIRPVIVWSWAVPSKNGWRVASDEWR